MESGHTRQENVYAGPSGILDPLLSINPYIVTPESKKRVEGDPTLYEVTNSGRVHKTPVKGSPASSKTPRKRRRGEPSPRSCRRTINFTNNLDSGSECDAADPGSECLEDDNAGDNNTGDNDVVDFSTFRRRARHLRNHMVTNEPDEWIVWDLKMLKDDVDTEVSETERNKRVLDLNVERKRVYDSDFRFQRDERMESDEIILKDDGVEDAGIEDKPNENERERITGAPRNTTFHWSEDFSTFKGQRESYSRTPGPTFSSQDPISIFLEIWDPEFMAMLVSETNKYAWQVISQFSDLDVSTGIPKYLETWTDVTVEELYRYFAILILMPMKHCSRIRDYWGTGVLGMPGFRELMSRNRFLLINKFLHFTSNENLVTGGHLRKIEKVAPVVNHCNTRFARLYIPAQHLSLDESLLLWKGRLSWRQCNRAKAARFGIKSFELCEAETGYLLQYRLYTGKDTTMYPDTLYGFQNHTAKVVLDLIEGYLDVGHVLVMDNWYNQLSLTRYLKTRRTDVLGTINRRNNGIPPDIKDLMPNLLERGETVSRHCGDIALVAWNDLKLVTAISTYHHSKMVPGIRKRKPMQKPAAIDEYNRYMGGVDLKDQKLSSFLMERKRNVKWYMKVFKRLLNTSLLNAFIIYTRNPMYQMYSHHNFRMKVAEGLLSRFPRPSSIPLKVSVTPVLLRLQPGDHFPIHTDEYAGPRNVKKHKQLRCVRCTAQKRRVLVTTKCKLCQVPLCIGQCWHDYHRVEKL